MKKILFLNLTNHSLTKEQLEAIEGLEKEKEVIIINFSDLVSHSNMITVPRVVAKEVEKLLPKLRQSPAYESELYGVVSALYDILDVIGQMDWDRVYVHMPTGSPSFMFLVAYTWDVRLSYLEKVYPVFSHTKREVTEIKKADGSVEKRTIFKFEKFIFPIGK